MKLFSGLMLTLLLCFQTNMAFACDASSINITNQVSNPDGTVTYTLDLLVELGGLDAPFYGFTLSFNSPIGTPIVTGFPATIGDADLSSGSFAGDFLTGLTNTDINSVVSDSDWNPYMNLQNVVSYEYGGIFGLTPNTFSTTIQVTVDGCVESIEFNSSVNSGSAACIFTASTGVTCNPPCSLDAIAAGAQTACDPGTNTYTQEVTVSYTNPPASGTLDVNGQSFPILASPQTVTLTGLTADGNAVDVLANFSANASCNLTEVGLFSAPASCSASPCTPDNGTWD